MSLLGVGVSGGVWLRLRRHRRSRTINKFRRHRLEPAAEALAQRKADAAAARTTNAAVHRGRYITGRRAGRGISETGELRRRDEDQDQARDDQTIGRGLRQT